MNELRLQMRKKVKFCKRLIFHFRDAVCHLKPLKQKEILKFVCNHLWIIFIPIESISGVKLFWWFTNYQSFGDSRNPCFGRESALFLCFIFVCTDLESKKTQMSSFFLTFSGVVCGENKSL